MENQPPRLGYRERSQPQIYYRLKLVLANRVRGPLGDVPRSVA